MSKPLLLLLCLGTALACAPAAARTSASTNGGDCPLDLAEEADARGSGAAPAKPVSRADKAAPSRTKNGTGALPRLGQPRWHSLLPGMFK